ncbi:MAG: HalX domain-containing protein [Haloarculaceae archaeon]
MTNEAPRSRPRVLVVEDERSLAELYAAWLAEEYAVETVNNGEAALAAYDADVDLVLLDRRLPGLSGDRVLEHVREQDTDCRVAMVSAVTPDFDIYGMGFDDYLVKPVSRDELLDLVERMLRVNEYDEGLRRHFALSSKLALLRSHKSEAELEDSEEYRALRDEFDELDRELTELVGEMSPSDVGAVLRDA